MGNLLRWEVALGYVWTMVKLTFQLHHDEDGLPDRWESEGLKDEQGNIVVDLPALGADPLHKDVGVMNYSFRMA